MSADPWQWDETLFAGSAPYYSRGRLPYESDIADALRDELDLDGTGRLLDVGCGPGSLTLLLAPLFAAAVGVDADQGMIDEARRQAALAGGAGSHIEWHCLRGEELPAGLGTFRAVTFAQSFHWMDQPAVAERVRGMLTPDGCWIHVHGKTWRGEPDVGDAGGLPHPGAPWPEIDELVKRYLGPVRRAGRGTLPNGTRGGEEDVMRQAGFAGPARIELAGGRIVERDADDIVALVYSQSSSAPHLFAERLPEFEADLRQVLLTASPSGRYSGMTPDTELVLWRPGRSGAR